GVGDKITLVGLDAVTGVVTDIDLFSTYVKTEKGPAVVPNREVSARAVIVLDPPPAPLILPPGVERPVPPAKPVDGASSDGSNPLGLPSLLPNLGKLLSSDTEKDK